MKFYTTSVPNNLPDWAAVLSTKTDLIEIEIDDNHPGFQSLLEELVTEIEPGTSGVKAVDLCSRLAIEILKACSNQTENHWRLLSSTKAIA